MLRKLKRKRGRGAAGGGGGGGGGDDDDDEYGRYYNRSSVQFKRKGAKGPNPLSAKKKKAKTVPAGPTADARPEKRKRPRRRAKRAGADVEAAV